MLIIKRMIYSLFILAILAGQVYAAAPSRTYTYTGGSTISSTEVNTNENSLYTYLQNGVDTISDGSITNADINASAGITYSKLNLTGSVVYADISSAARTSLVALAYPIGSIYISTSSTNPATSLGFGTWEAFGAGKVMVGLNASDSDFDTAEETGGAKTANLAHTHTVANTGWGRGGATTQGTVATASDEGNDYSAVTTANGVNTGSGGSATQSIMNPYIVVYFFKRTA